MYRRIIVEAVGARSGGGLRQLAPFLTALDEVLPPAIELDVYALPETAQTLPDLPRLSVKTVRASRGFSWRRLALDLVWLPIRSIAPGTALLSPLNLGPLWSRGPHVVYQRNILLFDDAVAMGGIERVKARWARRLVNRADAVITPGSAVAELVRLYTTSPVHVIAHGADDTVPASAAPHDGGEAALAWQGSSDLKLLTVSSMNTAHKDLRTQLEAVRVLTDRGIPVSWAVTLKPDDVGQGAQALGGVARELGIADRVHFLGTCGRTTIAWLYRTADIYISSSHQEAFGFPLIEASLEGCPSVCSDIPASHELLGDDAVGFFQPGNPVALASLVEGSVGRGRLPAEVVDAMRQRFSWASHAQQLWAIMRELERGSARAL